MFHTMYFCPSLPVYRLEIITTKCLNLYYMPFDFSQSFIYTKYSKSILHASYRQPPKMRCLLILTLLTLLSRVTPRHFSCLEYFLYIARTYFYNLTATQRHFNAFHCNLLLLSLFLTAHMYVH